MKTTATSKTGFTLALTLANFKPAHVHAVGAQLRETPVSSLLSASHPDAQGDLRLGVSKWLPGPSLVHRYE